MNLTAVYILLAVVIVVVIAQSVALVLLYRRGKGGQERGVSVEELQAVSEQLNQSVQNTVRIENSMLTGALNAQRESVQHVQGQIVSYMQDTNNRMDKLKDDVTQSISALASANAASIKEVRDSNMAAVKEVRDALTHVQELNVRTLTQVRDENAKQLELMRQTVDEKLNSTLENRFSQSFKLVNDRLEEINRTFTELQGLQTGVSDLNRIFKNVKTRGTWGEVSLENLLTQILTPEQFAKQVHIKRESDDAVDFVVRMPGNDRDEVLLPIDAKFPIEDYLRIAEAAERGDIQAVESASKALAATVKKQAMKIRDKYINPPKTTDFAIMYLPTEGLYAEVIKRTGLIEELQNSYRIVVCGPMTIAALLNSLQMGFRSVAVEKRSAEIGKLLQSFKKDFAVFVKALQATANKLDGVRKSIDDAERRTGIISKKLDKVDRLTGEETPAMRQLIQDTTEEDAFVYLDQTGDENEG